MAVAESSPSSLATDARRAETIGILNVVARKFSHLQSANITILIDRNGYLFLLISCRE